MMNSMLREDGVEYDNGAVFLMKYLYLIIGIDENIVMEMA